MHYYELENDCIMNHFRIPVKSFNIDLSVLLIFYDFDLTSRVLLNLGTLTPGVVFTLCSLSGYRYQFTTTTVA